MTSIEAVVFDVGETLVDETRPWGEWADHLGIPRRRQVLRVHVVEEPLDVLHGVHRAEAREDLERVLRTTELGVHDGVA